MRSKQYCNSILGFILLSNTLLINGQNLKILPLGNSLTKGVYCDNGTIIDCENRPDSQIIGYRYQLYSMLDGAGYAFEFVGNELAGWSVFPNVNLARHAGYPGITSDDLAVKVNQNSYYLLTSTDPDVILLEIGTNDIAGSTTDIEGVRAILNYIDAFEASAGKPVLVFLSKVIRFTQGTPNEELVSAFNANLQSLYNQRRSAGDLIELLDAGINLVNLKEPNGDMKDELHPNQGGYDKMALEWFEAIDNYNTAPVPSQIPDQEISEGGTFSPISLDNYIYDAEDPDAQITWTLQSAPQNLNVTINGSRQAIISTKDPNWYGSEDVTLIATDRGKTVSGLNKSVTITFTCKVNPVNDPPVILSQTRFPTTVEETSIAILLSDLQVQDIDNPPSQLSVQVLSGTNYSFSGNTVTPAINFNGELTVNVRVNDLQSSSPTFGFKISVSAKNDAPVIISGNTISFNEDIPYVLKLTDLQVSDPDNFYPADFTLIIGNGQHYMHMGDTIIPEKNFNGAIQVSVRVKDLLDQSNEFLLSVTVLPVNDPPSMLIPDGRSAFEGDYFEIQLQASDVDLNDLPQISSVSLPAWLTYNAANGKLSGTPLHQNVGNNPVKMRVNDTHLSVDSTFAIEVKLKSGINNTESDPNRFIVSPNPAATFIRISANNPSDIPAMFRLISISGILMLEQKLLTDDTTLYLNDYDLSPGIYLYEIVGKTGDLFKGRLVISAGAAIY